MKYAYILTIVQSVPPTVTETGTGNAVLWLAPWRAQDELWAVGVRDSSVPVYLWRQFSRREAEEWVKGIKWIDRDKVYVIILIITRGNEYEFETQNCCWDGTWKYAWGDEPKKSKLERTLEAVQSLPVFHSWVKWCLERTLRGPTPSFLCGQTT